MGTSQPRDGLWYVSLIELIGFDDRDEWRFQRSSPLKLHPRSLTLESSLMWYLGIGTLTVLCLITTLLPFVPMAHGVFRVFEFPRTQIAVIAFGCLVLALLVLPVQDLLVQLIIGALVAVIAIQLVYIARFSPFWRRRSAQFKGNPADTPIINVLVCNVKQGNREYVRLCDLFQTVEPDLAIFMETDQKWIDALDKVGASYPHRMACPMDNAYGLLLYSRFPISEEETRFLLNDEVPSFHLTLTLEEGRDIRLIAVHPEPPVVYDDTIGRDAEIALVGQIVRNEDRPAMVTGDLNDVAWSRTTRRFLRISGMLDPREGRGQFNTFDARYPFLRWPLDHIFHSPQFQLVSMKRMPFVGSDHFPMFYRLALTTNEQGRREVDDATSEDIEEAKDLVDIESDRDRRPIGVDWEPKES
ncbi:endonuclease/exonuclease/phosphatase family protein [Ahrensia sp. R2A130]|uniref:endonuclease/exonuclease/phosphatase family protein n=1 Tax=Ahrensia sp. R2A130 TaxID=744979 RepID=UPI0001E0A497|nr:endonuclease/exonuclease/phosphatase family protein [Ahrensia sp. R2A130]EFL88630.1 YD repeat-containing protein [Ahrensia sp. R2A130]